MTNQSAKEVRMDSFSNIVHFGDMDYKDLPTTNYMNYKKNLSHTSY